ncbi:MAG: CoA activase [Candidatus Hydrogenedentes bacterium]|nr:CoA activase [Candidatus Hydrogenedentota bacterium]
MGCCSTSTSSSSCGTGSCGTATAAPAELPKSSCSSGGNCGCATKPAELPQVRAPRREFTPFQGTERYPQGLLMGLDVGSTTVKAVLVDPETDEILWKDYQRHETKQPEKCLELLQAACAALPGVPHNAVRVFITGSGGAGVGRHIGARFVQEVNAVSLAVEKLYPDVMSVVELGGQDAKIIVFKENEDNGSKKKIPSMNDKCAGGTGAVIDKINAKLKIPAEKLCQMGYVGHKLHPVAGKCGVFAETDINGLQKQGVPREELMASLFESIIQQNLSVLTRGHTLLPNVLLLGGPNCYVKGMAECWRHNIPQIWKERNVPVPDRPLEELVKVPENAQYFAAIGAVEFGKSEIEDDANTGAYQGTDQLRWYLDVGRVEEKKAAGRTGLVKTSEELDGFYARYTVEPWEPAAFAPGSEVEGYIGIDGGSTSTKAVLIGRDKEILAKVYQLSNGNPIEDTMDVLAQLEAKIHDQGCKLKVLGVGTTGYAKDVLKDVLNADVALVETVAHTQSGLHFYPDADVICDVGGQDIKVIILRNGAVKDFKLNTQCSAGNGYFLQSTAQDFGVDVRRYADVAFQAEAMPEFGYGCAVFMQSDIVDFQRQGWQAPEIMAGLADVLPKNIWLYVSQIPNLPKLGSTFVLQGGTQNNMAAVKAQADFITSRFHGTGIDPRVIVHKHCGESGAIGAAFEAHRLHNERRRNTTFIGMGAVHTIEYRTTRDENTRCYFCKNNCLRTFIDVKSAASKEAANIALDANTMKFNSSTVSHTRMKRGASEEEKKSPDFESKVPLAEDEQRLIIATCEKGTVEDVNDMKQIKKGLDTLKEKYPNLVDRSAVKAFMPVTVENLADPPPAARWYARGRRRAAIQARRAAMDRRGSIRIGMPKALNMYSQAPFFMAFFQSLGIRDRNLVWSDFTSEGLYKEGAKRGSIDPCFPSKVGIPHVHNLLYHKHTPKKPLDYILFPMVDSFPTWLENILGSRACPTVTATPEAVHAAFIKERDLFAEKGIVYKKTFLNMDNPALCAKQMYEDWGAELGLSMPEARRATDAGLKALADFYQARRDEARAMLDTLEREQRLGIVLLARPYHNDPGINHEIMDEFQKLGYPVFTQDSLPIDSDIIDRLFGDEIARGEIDSGFDIADVWKNSYSENTSRKVWAAKYVARHPNLVALELSNFKCGHDAPIYTVIEEIVENSGTPFFYFKDIDENKPAGAIKIRVETIGYFLKRYREDMIARAEKIAKIEADLAAYDEDLRHPERAMAAAS